MKIKTKFIQELLFLGIGLLVAVNLVLAVFEYRAFQEKISGVIESQLSQAKSIIEKNYSVGNIVTLKSEMSEFATRQNWVSGEFSDPFGEKIWAHTVGTQITESAKHSESDNKNPGILAVLLYEEQAVYSKEVALISSAGSKSGVLAFSVSAESFRADALKVLGKSAMISSIFLLLLLYAAFLIHRKTLSPVAQLINMVEREMIDVELINTAGKKISKDLHDFESLAQTFSSLVLDWKNAQSERLQAATNQQIAQMTQMLAHDIRKPLSMMKAALDLVRATKDPETLMKTSAIAFEEVEHALVSASGLIQDVMEIGSKGAIHKEATDLNSIIQRAVTENLRLMPEGNYEIEYHLAHKQSVDVDAAKVHRVFSNIIGNAFQAMGRNGKLEVATAEVTETFVSVSLTNYGSFISSEDCEKLFEAFYTKGKKGGTGLGLAIAKKVVTAHGGKIWCESGKAGDKISATEQVAADSFVCFSFLLPICGPANINGSASKLFLPKSSAEMRDQAQKALAAAMGSSHQNLAVTPPFESNETVREVVKRIREVLSNDSNFQVAVVDDEAIYRKGVLNSFERIKEIWGPESSKISIEEFSSGEALIAKFEIGACHQLVILDVDLGQTKLSGFEVAKDLRHKGYEGYICIHSNRITSVDYQNALDAGAEAFIPKPLSAAHFVTLLEMSLKKSNIRSQSASFTAVANPKNAQPRIAFVDDSFMMRLAWKAKTELGEIETFESPEAYFGSLNEDPNRKFDLVVTDFHFDEKSELNGIEFAKALKEKVPAQKIALASGGEFERSETESLFCAIIGKEVLSKAQIQKILEMEC